MSIQTTALRAGQTLTISANAFSSGSYNRLGVADGDGPYSPVAIAASASAALGPFAQDRRYAINSDSGALTFAISVVDFPTSPNDDFEGIAATRTSVLAGETKTIGATSQAIIFGTLTVTGTLVNSGELRIGPWPF